MATRKTGRPLGRPMDAQKRATILEAGWAMFLERGVEAVSLQAVAAKASVSKATLYKHFPDRLALFEAGVLLEMERIEAAQKVDRGKEVQAGDLATTLRDFGLGIVLFLFSDPAVAFYNELAGELSRHPSLARRFYDLGPGRTKTNLSRILAAADARGQVAIDDPEEAAEHLFGLWQGFSNFQLALGVEGKEIRKEVPARVERAVSIFLRAYAPARSKNGNNLRQR